MKILKIENLKKVYGKGEAEVIAVNNVSFEVEEGEFVAIIGPSGSGKSTILHMIAGLEKPTSGKVYFYGKNMYEMNKKDLTILRRQKIGIIYQFYNLISTLNVEENITLPIELDKKKVNREKLDEITKFLNIDNRKKHLPNEISGGQQQKVAIGRALIINPTIILADEPTGNLDSNSSEVVMRTLESINGEMGKTILLVTHDPMIASFCKRIIFLKDGQVIENLKRADNKEMFYQEILKRMKNL